MDVVNVYIANWDPTVEDVKAYKYLNRYLVQTADHICHENKVTYTLGRIEIWENPEVQPLVETVITCGHGETRNERNYRRRMQDKAVSADSHTLI
jgi:hypothetical protein